MFKFIDFLTYIVYTAYYYKKGSFWGRFRFKTQWEDTRNTISFLCASLGGLILFNVICLVFRFIFRSPISKMGLKTEMPVIVFIGLWYVVSIILFVVTYRRYSYSKLVEISTQYNLPYSRLKMRFITALIVLLNFIFFMALVASMIQIL